MIHINNDWTLFLDRDGVINVRIPNDYIKTPEQFEFIEGVPEALRILKGKFQHIIVVTNQQGIGRGLMSENQLKEVHKKMNDLVIQSGGNIDAIFHSPDLKNQRSFTRKPAVGMGLKARNKFPKIRFKNSIMVGDTHSDILFGYRLGMTTVMVGNDINEIKKCGDMLHFSFANLLEFAKSIHTCNNTNSLISPQ